MLAIFNAALQWASLLLRDLKESAAIEARARFANMTADELADQREIDRRIENGERLPGDW